MTQFKKWIVGTIALVVLVALAYLSFTGSDTSGSEPIKIGFIGPLTGENAVIGEGIKNSIMLAAEGRDVQLIYEDDQFTGRLGVAAYHKLRNVDNVDAIINTTPAVADAIAPLLKDDPMVVVQIAEPGSSADDTIFQIMPSGATVYAALGKIAKDAYPSFAFVYQSGATFEKAKDSFKKEYEDPTHVFREYRVDEGKDLRTVIAKIRSEGVAAYTVIATPSLGAPFIKQLREQRVRSDMLCNADMEVTIGEYLKVLPEKAFDGCVSVMFADRMSDSFKRDYRGRFGIDPGFASDYGFDAVMLLADTYDKKESTWIEALKAVNFGGASGAIQFDGLGVRIPEIETHVFRDGKFVVAQQ